MAQKKASIIVTHVKSLPAFLLLDSNDNGCYYKLYTLLGMRQT